MIVNVIVTWEIDTRNVDERRNSNLTILFYLGEIHETVGFGYRTPGFATTPIVQAPTFVCGLKDFVFRGSY